MIFYYSKTLTIVYKLLMLTIVKSTYYSNPLLVVTMRQTTKVRTIVTLYYSKLTIVNLVLVGICSSAEPEPWCAGALYNRQTGTPCKCCYQSGN